MLSLVETEHQQQVPHLNNQEQQMSQHSPNTNTSSTSNPPLANIKEKTPMCLVNELGRFVLYLMRPPICY